MHHNAPYTITSQTKATIWTNTSNLTLLIQVDLTGHSLSSDGAALLAR